MLSSPHLLYCNCVSVPVLHCSDAYAPWYCPLPTTASEYGTCLDNAPTHRELNNVHGEPSAEECTTSRRLKFGIENILYGRPSRTDHISVHERFPSNQELSFIARQPFPSPVRTSTRPWCRPVFTQLQRRGLEKRFQITKYVTKRERLQIGAMLGLSETQVKVWFQNRRTKWRHEAAKKEEKQKEEALKEAKEVQEKEEVANSEEEKEGKDALTDLCSSTTKESPKILKKD
ncbi:homeobox protein CDX-2-like [Montipora capricornis]|uniref:homeobox protein CDX-2-like n=1 Tax=Montipora capricornis TaxID=246305 RepID=UPI0035F12632